MAPKAKVSTGGTGQKNLFSFFAKKPGDAAPPTAAKPIAAIAKAADTVVVPPPPDEDDVGRRLEVFWPDDDEWFAGTVTKYDPGSQKHFVDYDDGTSEDLVLSQEQARHGCPLRARPPASVSRPLRILFRPKSSVRSANRRRERSHGAHSL